MQASVLKWKWLVWAVILGLSVAVWYRVSRPDPTRPAIERLGPLDLDLVEVPAGELSSPFEGPARLRGRIADRDGQPLAEIWVRLRVNHIALAATRTDPRGRFELSGLPTGKADLVCGGPGYSSRVLPEFFLGEDTEELSIELEARRAPVAPLTPPATPREPDASLVGKCLSGIERAVFFEVQLEPMRPTDPGTRRITSTDAEGRGFFSFAEVMPGRYRLAIRAARGPARVDIPFGLHEDLEIAPGSTRNLALPTPVVALQGTVSAAPGGAEAATPIEGAFAWMLWRPAGSGEDSEEIFAGRCRSDAGGRFRFPLIPPGELRLVVRKAGHEPLEHPMSCPRAGEQAVELRLRPL